MLDGRGGSGPRLIPRPMKRVGFREDADGADASIGTVRPRPRPERVFAQSDALADRGCPHRDLGPHLWVPYPPPWPWELKFCASIRPGPITPPNPGRQHATDQALSPASPIPARRIRKRFVREGAVGGSWTRRGSSSRQCVPGDMLFLPLASDYRSWAPAIGTELALEKYQTVV